MVYSLVVKALQSPPTSSSDSAMAAAERVGVPLKSRCSRKCDAPASSSDSSREPEPTQYATATERTSAMVSVTRRMPLGRTEVSINGDASGRAAGGGRRHCCCGPPLRPRPGPGPRARRPARPRRRPRRRAPRCRPAPEPEPAPTVPAVPVALAAVAVAVATVTTVTGHCARGRRLRLPESPEDAPSARLRAPRPATGTPCPAGRCRPPAPRSAGPASARPRRC